MPKRIRNENLSGEAIKEKTTVYFACPVVLLREFEQVAKVTGFLSKEEAIRQAMREFLQNYTPEYVIASRNTETSIRTMADMYEKYANVPSMVAAMKAQSAGNL